MTACLEDENVEVSVNVESVDIVVESAEDIVLVGSPPESVEVVDEPVPIAVEDTAADVVAVDQPVVVEVVTGVATVAADLIWPASPDVALSYDSEGRLERVDYANGAFKTLDYGDDDELLGVSGEDALGNPRTVTLGYSAGQLTSVTRT